MSNRRGGGGGGSGKHSQIYIDNLKEFLESADWQEQLSMFVDANCDKFHNVTDYMLDHHKIWQDFISIAESVLAMGMESLGGSLEKLEAAIDEMSRSPASGPRDEQFKEILNRLLTFHSFEDFAANMKRAAQDKRRGQSQMSAAAQQRNYRSTQDQVTPFAKFRGDLEALGFELDMIQIVCEGAKRDVSLEELVMLLSELGCVSPTNNSSKPAKPTPPRHNFRSSSGTGNSASSPSNGANGASNNSISPHVGRRSNTMNKYYDEEQDQVGSKQNYEGDAYEDIGEGNYDGNGVSPAKSDVSGEDFIFDVLSLFIKEGNLTEDASELYSKFATAKSVLDLMVQGKRCCDLGYDETNQNNLVDWSTEMMELYEDIGRAYQQKLSQHVGSSRFTNLLQGNSDIFKEPNQTRYGKSFYKSYSDLEKIRTELNSSSSHGMLSDYEMKRMAELDNIASSGTADEQKLHKLITRFDSLQKEINDCHKNVSLAVASNRSIDRVRLEEMYLYLKEMVSNDADISQLSDELYSKVITVSSVDTSANKKSIFVVVGILLDMHILEDEQYMLRREIDNLVGGSPSSQGRDQSQSKGDGGIELGHVITDERGGHGDNSCGNNNNNNNNNNNGKFDAGAGGAHGDSKQYDGEGHGYGNANEEWTACYDEASGAYYYYNNRTGETSWTNPNDLQDNKRGAEYKSPRAESKGDYNSSSAGRDSKGGSLSNLADSTSSMSAAEKNINADYLNTLKTTQKSSLQALKGSLDAEKSRRMSILEDKLRKKKMRQGIEGMPSDRELSETEMHDLIAKSVKDIEREIAETKGYFEAVHEGLVAGYKQKCMTEMKETKNKGRALTEKEQDDCRLDVLKALKDKHEKEQKALVEGLEFERQKQKQRILKSLAQKKQKLQSQGGNIDQQALDNYIAEEVKLELENLHNHFDATILEVSSKPQCKAFMAFSAVMIDDNTIASMSNCKTDGDDEDDYLEDSPSPKAGANAEVPQWLDNIESTCNNFLSAGQELQNNMVKGARHYADDMSVETAIELLDNVNESGDAGDSGASELGGVHSVQVINTAFTKALTDVMSQSDSDLRWHKKKSDANAALEAAKQDIISEFKKSQAKYSEDLESARLKSLHVLASRRAQQKNKNIGSSASDDTSDSKEITSVEVIKKGGAGNSINSLIDSFLDTPLEISKNAKTNKVSAYGGVSNSKANYKLSPLKTGPNYVLNPFISNEVSASSDAKSDSYSTLPGLSLRQNRQQLEEAHEVESKAERDMIKARYNSKEKELVDGLYSQMMQKKSLLQDKLRKKQEERDRLRAQNAASADFVEGAGASMEDMNDAEEIRKLETAYDKVVDMVKTTEGSEMINLDSAIATMNKLASSRGVDAKSTSDQYTEQLRDVETKQKEIMKEEAKRIASTYNEEKEKYDLMMAMQQARQRQNLQRKLLEKKQQSLQVATGGGGSGQSPVRLPFGVSAELGSAFINEPTSAAAIEHHKLLKQMSSRGMGMQNLMRR